MITKEKSKNPILAWIQNEDNMNMLYGLGAAVVILGALFKLQGWPGANLMLILGLGAEAIIFTVSAQSFALNAFGYNTFGILEIIRITVGAQKP